MNARIALVIGLFASTALAKPARKVLPDKFTRAAGAVFAQAAAADAAGDRGQAIALYRKAFLIVPDPSIAFNLAELELEAGDLDGAVVDYDLYLALAPSAADRAEIGKAIAQIEHTPGELVILPHERNADAIDLTSAYTLVDGVVVQAPGVASGKRLTVAAGDHVIDVITALTVFSRVETVAKAHKTTVEVDAHPRIDGNVVVSAHELKVSLASKELEHTTRTTVAPGRHRVAVHDGSVECAPITIDAPAGSDRVLYVHIGLAEKPTLRHDRCPAVAVTQQVLVFKP